MSATFGTPPDASPTPEPPKHDVSDDTLMYDMERIKKRAFLSGIFVGIALCIGGEILLIGILCGGFIR